MPQLCNKETCTGCTACTSICPRGCIEMLPDMHGFLYPTITKPKDCTHCGLCEKVCPVVTHLRPEGMPQVYAAMAKDTEMRLQSSSGGVFSLIAKVVLSQGGAVFGAAYSERFEVEHICAENEDDLAKLLGAKYAQSDLRQTFSDVKKRLNLGQQVLFSGTPCQVAGLKAFLRREYENLLTVDFVCHSVPSPAAWISYVRYRALQDQEGVLPQSINLRSKHTGWSRYRYSNLFIYPGSSYSSSSNESLFMKLFTGNYINRTSCESCRFKGYARVSDLTLGDFWGIWNICPEMDDDKGTSVVLIQSAKGQKIWENIRNQLDARSMTVEEAGRENPALLRPSHRKENRDQVLHTACSGDFDSLKGLFLEPKKPTFAMRVKNKLKRMLRI